MVDLTRLEVPGCAGLKGLVVSRVPKLRVSGSSGTEGLPRLTGAFYGLVFPQPNGFRIQGIKGLLRAPRSGIQWDDGLLGTCRSFGLKVPRA